MKFHEVPVGDKFVYNNETYVKIPEIRKSCCKIQQNAQKVSDKTVAVIKPLEEVTKA
jgi:hypothetical protein